MQISGRIDEDVAEQFQSRLQDGATVELDSLGGDASSAWHIGQELYDARATVEVKNNCVSACAEFLLPAARQLFVSPRSLIGYHGGDFMFDRLARRFLNNVSFVDPERLSWLEVLYGERRLSRNFSAEVQQRLDVRFVRRDNSADVPQLAIFSVNSLWFPTSDQLRNLLGLPIAGPVCADDRRCWEPRIVAISRAGERMVVGDQVVEIGENGAVEVSPWAPSSVQIRVVQAVER
ncbi:hypothetical protein [Brevundimonas sp. TWP2-3-2]|uniref:hypothetical protein n=1 Tax=unclassified Brevundimonas TaxID=2622653 RepID=UPI003CE79F9A